MTENCAWCQFSLKANFLSQTHLLPCSHQIHRHCLVNWADHIYRTDPSAKTLSCLICRKPTPIPTKHSAEQILEWIKIAKKIALAMGFVFGANIGLGIATIGKRYSSSLERICKTAHQTINISPVISLPLMTGSLALAASCFFICSKNQSWLTTIVVSAYNRIHETCIGPYDIWLYQSGLLSQSSQVQFYETMRFFIHQQLLTMSFEIDLIPFNEEEKKCVDPLAPVLNSLQEEKQFNSLTALLAENLKLQVPGLHAQLVQIGARLLEGSGNEQLKKQLAGIIDQYLLDVLNSKSNETFAIPDSKMAVRITLVNALELFKDSIEWKRAEKKEKWILLLSQFQEECRDPTSTLIDDLQSHLAKKYNFSALSLAQLLWEPDLVDDIFNALNYIRKEVFEEKGFSVSITEKFE